MRRFGLTPRHGIAGVRGSGGAVIPRALICVETLAPPLIVYYGMPETTKALIP